MKKIIFFTAIAFLTLSSCRKDVTTLAEEQALVQSQPQANASSSQLQTNASSSEGAEAFHGSFEVHYDGLQVYNSCTNEQMTVYGFEKVTFHGINNGTKSTITFHVNMPGTIRGVGESGRKYVINNHTLYQESHFSNGASTTKFVNSLHTVTAGGGNNFIIKQSSYIKVDADKNVTVIRDPVFESYCQ